MIELLLQAERALSVGLLDRAETLYRQVARADPLNSIAIVGLARVTLDRGDDVEALALARRALEIDPENDAAIRLAARLEEVIDYRFDAAEALGLDETDGEAPEAAPEFEPPSQPEFEPAPDPEPDPEPEPEVEPDPEPQPEPEPESMTRLEPEPEPSMVLPPDPILELGPAPDRPTSPTTVPVAAVSGPTLPVPPRRRSILDRLLRRG